MGYVFIASTILCTVYGNLVIKWQTGLAGPQPEALFDKVVYFVRLLPNPWVLSTFPVGFLAFATWVLALSKFELSYAYPFMSLSFVMTLFLSAAVFQESLTAAKIVGVSLIVLGIIIGSRG